MTTTAAASALDLVKNADVMIVQAIALLGIEVTAQLVEAQQACREAITYWPAPQSDEAQLAILKAKQRAESIAERQRIVREQKVAAHEVKRGKQRAKKKLQTQTDRAVTITK
ncbi:MAG TPA: hypothetical protein VGQ08_15750 [Nitrospiraceae bacterium]|jgi:hypothetical protein|nr:hypothetical protein [Nitrospiraceae bacterium]